MKHFLLYSGRKFVLGNSLIMARILSATAPASVLLENAPFSSATLPAISAISSGNLLGKQLMPIPIINLSILPVSRLV